MDLSTARASIHAMLTTDTDEDAAELDQRINDLVSAVRHDTTGSAPRRTCPEAEPDTNAADFFEPGRVYTRNLPYRAPEDRPNFQCIAVAEHPTKGGRRAFGFEQSGAGTPWVSAAMRDAEWDSGWVALRRTCTELVAQPIRSDLSA